MFFDEGRFFRCPGGRGRTMKICGPERVAAVGYYLYYLQFRGWHCFGLPSALFIADEASNPDRAKFSFGCNALMTLE